MGDLKIFLISMACLTLAIWPRFALAGACAFLAPWLAYKLLGIDIPQFSYGLIALGHGAGVVWEYGHRRQLAQGVEGQPQRK